MKLQPMTTAPRDGTPIWVLVGDDVLLKLTCSGPDSPWISPNRKSYFEDCEVAGDGWLDIEALVRDSERLDTAIGNIAAFHKLVDEVWSACADTPPENSKESLRVWHEQFRASVRAAIDKEMNRG